MFLITASEVREQDGEAKYYMFLEDIEGLAVNEVNRRKVLDALGETSIMVSTVTQSCTKAIRLDELLDCGTGIHSRL